MKRLKFNWGVDPYCCGLLTIGDFSYVLPPKSLQEGTTVEWFLADLMNAARETGTTAVIAVTCPCSQPDETAVLQQAFKTDGVPWTSRTTGNGLLLFFCSNIW